MERSTNTKAQEIRKKWSATVPLIVPQYCNWRFSIIFSSGKYGKKHKYDSTIDQKKLFSSVPIIVSPHCRWHKKLNKNISFASILQRYFPRQWKYILRCVFSDKTQIYIRWPGLVCYKNYNKIKLGRLRVLKTKLGGNAIAHAWEGLAR